MNAIDLLGEPLITRIGWTLLHTMWQGIFIALLLALALRILRHGSAPARYASCCAALALLVLAPTATFIVLAQHDAVVPSPPLASSRNNGSVASIAPAPVPTMILPAPAPDASSDASTLRLVVLAWATGVAVMALYHIAGWTWLLRLRRGLPLTKWHDVMQRLQKRLRITRRVLLIETSRIDVPAVVGVLRPMILVPVGGFSGLTPQQVEAILAHELAHIRRHDYLVNLLQAAVESLMFYHPATWWISRRIRAERENCCDDIAQSICGDRRTYASALAALEERRGATSGALATAATGGDLLTRIRRILNLPPARPRRLSMRSLAAAVLAITCIALPLLVNAQQNEQPDPPADELAEEISSITPADLQANVQDYRTGAGDALSVSITDLVGPGVETVKQVTVSDSGIISLPLIGAINVAGKTVPEIETVIQKAYRDAKLMPNAQISVTITDARQRLFSVLGDVEKPGQYAMPQADFRALDALALAGTRTADAGTLRILRAREPKRVIEVPLEKLAAGDMSVNVVIRPGDTIIAAPQPKRFIKIVVAPESLLHEGKPIDRDALNKLLEAIPQAQRRKTVLEVAAAAPDVTVERFFSAVAELAEAVKRHDLAYLSQTGIVPTAEGAPASSFPPRNERAALLELRQQLQYQLMLCDDKLGPNHPMMLQLRRMIEGIDRKIQELAAKMSLEQIAQVDATMRQYLQTKEEMEFNLSRMRQNLGPHHREVKGMEADLKLQQQRIDAYAATFRKRIGATTQP